MTGRLGLPLASRRSKDEIRAVALGLVQKHYPQCAKEPAPVPIDHFIEFVIPQMHSVVFGVEDLPPALEAVTSPAIDGQPAQIILSSRTYDALGKGFTRARFTAAHEGAHGILHVHEISVRLTHGDHIGLYRKSEIPYDRNPERQADVFAAAFLMPAPAVRVAAQYLGPNVRILADTFQVSDTAMSIRLGELGIR
jgi:IrrE N-terminal-like domain